MAAHLFVAHELAEGQRRGRVCLFSGLGAQKATRPNKRSKQVGEIRGRNINIRGVPIPFFWPIPMPIPSISPMPIPIHRYLK